jgi:hypothetical protein
MTELSSGDALETFYVYRSLHSDESWNAVLGICRISKLPNVDFGMRVFAKNEKEAIARGRDLYEKIHKWDSDKDNIRRFAAAALKSMSSGIVGKGPLKGIGGSEIKTIAEVTMKLAIATNEEYNKYFESLDNENTEGI